MGPWGLPRSGRATPSSRDYETLVRHSGGGLVDYEPWRGASGQGDYEHLSFGGLRGGSGLPQPPLVAPKPRLTSVEEDVIGGPTNLPFKRAPPPLPPKPTRVPPPLPLHAQHLHSNFGKGAGSHGPPGDGPHSHDLPVGVTRTKSGLYLGLPGEKGYNVSFV